MNGLIVESLGELYQDVGRAYLDGTVPGGDAICRRLAVIIAMVSSDADPEPLAAMRGCPSCHFYTSHQNTGKELDAIVWKCSNCTHEHI